MAHRFLAKKRMLVLFLLMVALLTVFGAGFLLVGNAFPTTSAPRCTDSDNGKNFLVQGRTCFKSDHDCFEDTCLNNVELEEYYCENGMRFSMQYRCGNGTGLCFQGACYIPVCTPKDLDNVRNDLNNNYKQVCDIDLNGYPLKPIGGNNAYGQPYDSFEGLFDGSGYAIYNFSYSNPSRHHVGLFGSIKKPAVLRNITLKNCNVVGRRSVGSLVGENSGVHGKGGLVMNSHVFDCNVSSSFSTSVIGGLVGDNTGGTISDSSFRGTVQGIDLVGGLVGGHFSGLGESTYSAINDSRAIATVSGQTAVGGLVGVIKEAHVLRSSVIGTVDGNLSVGGLVGSLELEGTVSDSFSQGTVHGQSRIGGLIGSLPIGEADITITNSYSSSLVSGLFQTGGLIGYDAWHALIVHSYWDKEASGQESSAGGEGRTTAEMTSVPRPPNTYVDWDFSESGTWVQEDGNYPVLFIRTQ